MVAASCPGAGRHRARVTAREMSVAAAVVDAEPAGGGGAQRGTMA